MARFNLQKKEEKIRIQVKVKLSTKKYLEQKADENDMSLSEFGGRFLDWAIAEEIKDDQKESKRSVRKKASESDKGSEPNENSEPDKTPKSDKDSELGKTSESDKNPESDKGSESDENPEPDKTSESDHQENEQMALELDE